jgi:type I restriction enzyme, S subunit
MERVSKVTSCQIINADGMSLLAEHHVSAGAYYLGRLLGHVKTVPLRELGKVVQVIIFGKKQMQCSQAKGIPLYPGSEILRTTPKPSTFLHPRYVNNFRFGAICKRNWILLTLSGTVGSVSYVDHRFQGSFVTDDAMRIVAENKPWGFLYSLLKSRYYRAIIENLQYGTIIKHIHHSQIEELPIPYFSIHMMNKVHSLIEESSELMTEAASTVASALRDFDLNVLGTSETINYRYPRDRYLACQRTRIQNMRLDAYHHVGYCREGRDLIKRPTVLGSYIRAYQPPIFKRPYVKDGIPFMSGMDLYDAHPQVTNQLSRKMQGIDKYIVNSGTILVQNVGQRYGLFGRPVVLHRHLDKCAVTQHLTRIYPKKESDKGFVYFFLLSEIGRRCLLGNSFGTSMGVLFDKSFMECPCPEVDGDLRDQFSKPFTEFVRKRDQAIAKEKEAVQLVEQELSKWLD